MYCSHCGRDINAIGQDNCSYIPGYPLCEDCACVTDIDFDCGNDFDDCIDSDYEPSDEEVEE
jgi:hypothetical protein